MMRRPTVADTRSTHHASSTRATLGPPAAAEVIENGKHYCIVVPMYRLISLVTSSPFSSPAILIFFSNLLLIHGSFLKAERERERDVVNTVFQTSLYAMQGRIEI